MAFYKCPPTDLSFITPKTRKEVQYAVSYTYNGGTILGDEWYEGYEVPPPLLSPGYVILGIGVGLELNARPPLATGVVVPESRLTPGMRYMNISGEWKRVPEQEEKNGD